MYSWRWLQSFLFRRRFPAGRANVSSKPLSRPWIPGNVLDRPKRGFSMPVASWLRNELRQLPAAVLLDSRARERGMFERREVERLIATHQSGTADNSNKLWALIQLELWFRTYVDAIPRGRSRSISRSACRSVPAHRDPRFVSPYLVQPIRALFARQRTAARRRTSPWRVEELTVLTAFPSGSTYLRLNAKVCETDGLGLRTTVPLVKVRRNRRRRNTFVQRPADFGRQPQRSKDLRFRRSHR